MSGFVNFLEITGGKKHLYFKWDTEGFLFLFYFFQNETLRNLYTFSLLRPSLIILSFEAEQKMKTLIDFLPY